MRVLVVDDDPEIVDIVTMAFNMRWPDAEILQSPTGEAALETLERERPDLVLLDIAMPGAGGHQTLQQIRLFTDVPVVMLSGKSGVPEKVKALREGADDYVTKPFDSLELLARVEAVLRRSGAAQTAGGALPFLCGHLSIDFESRQVRVSGEPVELTPLEYRLLLQLARSAGRIVPYETLLTRVWGPDRTGELNCLRVYVRRLRRKLEEDPKRPRYVLTQSGRG